MSRTTFQDVIDHLVDYVGGTPGQGDALARDAKRATLEAYRDLANAFNWSYLFNRGRVLTRGPFTDGTITYTHTGGAYERLLTLSGGIWPEWVAGATLASIDSPPHGMIDYKVTQRISATQVVLDEQINPGEDITTPSAYTLACDTYLLPSDYTAQDQSIYEGNFGGMEFVHPRAWANDLRFGNRCGVPRIYTITGDNVYPGRLTLKLSPFPSVPGQSISFLYKRRPRPLVLSLINTGTVGVAQDSRIVTASSAIFTPAMVGCVLRIGTATQLPTAVVDANPAAFESTIAGYISATVVTVNDGANGTYTARKFTVSDPIDIEEGAMLNAFLRCCEKCIGQNRTLKDKPSAQKLYLSALGEAKAADSRSFAGRSAHYPVHHRHHTPWVVGPDDIN